MGDWASVEGQASTQDGCITREQLFAAGFGADALAYALRSGRLAHLLPGAYRFRSSTESPRQLACAARLTLGPSLVFSHDSARTLWRLHGAAARLTLPIHVTLPRQYRPRLPNAFCVHRTQSLLQPVTQSGLPTTRIARTIIDLAAVLSELELEELLDATHLRFYRLEAWLREELRDNRQFAGRQTLERLLAVRDGQQVESVFETRIRRVLRGSNTLTYRTQYPIHDARGFISRVDFAWPQHRVAVLCDSYKWHASRKQFDLDAAQRARLAALDWLCVPVTWAMRNDPIWTTHLALALDRRLPQPQLAAHGFSESLTGAPT